jgi:ArsR family transcriptional regulator
MIKKPASFYEARANVAKALAHPSRLLILEALQEGEMCVCELTDLVGSDQSTVSKHLSVLKQTGIVDTRKEGSMIFYRLRIACLNGFFSCVENVLKDRLEWDARRAAG